VNLTRRDGMLAVLRGSLISFAVLTPFLLGARPAMAQRDRPRPSQPPSGRSINMGPWAPAAALAAKEPPASLGALSIVPLSPDDKSGTSITVDFAVSCKQCRQAAFRISAFPKVVPDPSPYAQIAPGETFWRPPHSLKCVNCGAVGRAFDARTDGYDGILNGGCSYESGNEGEAFVPGVFKVTISATYNVELYELTEISETVKVRPPDLFDWFVIHGDPVDGGKPFEVGYECA
jgi:hypothetical protein